jgi:hypothetical protein
MITLIRVTRVLVILVLASMTLSFVIGISRPETGAVEKVVMLGLIAACIFLAAKVTTLAASLQQRLRH